MSVDVLQRSVPGRRPVATAHRPAPKCAAPPIDHAHLARYTLDNRELEIEVLQLFAGQAPLTLAELIRATAERDWHIAAHSLKGSARAVGAWAVAKAAETAEKAGIADPRRSELMADVAMAIEEASSYIAGLR